jgi:hypothetical protein
MNPATLRLIASGRAKKGDVLGWRASPPSRRQSACQLIPLAHPSP